MITNEMESQNQQHRPSSWRVLTRLWCRLSVRWWLEPSHLFLFLPHTNCIWSVAPAQADVDSATYEMVSQCGAAGQPKLHLNPAHTRLWCRLLLRWRPEQSHLFLFLPHANCIWSVAPAQADVDGATSDMVSHCAAARQPKMDLIPTHARLWCRLWVRWRPEPAHLFFFLPHTNCIRSVAPAEADVDNARYDVVSRSGDGNAASPNCTSTRHIQGCSVVCGWDDGLSRLICFYSYPILTVFGQ